MTRDEIIRMMREACDTDKVDAWGNGFWTITQEEIERFAALVAAAERARPRTIKARLLDELARHPDGLTVSELRERTGARDARCILHRLYRDGVVERGVALTMPTGGRQHRYRLKL